MCKFPIPKTMYTQTCQSSYNTSIAVTSACGEREITFAFRGGWKKLEILRGILFFRRFGIEKVSLGAFFVIPSVGVLCQLICQQIEVLCATGCRVHLLVTSSQSVSPASCLADSSAEHTCENWRNPTSRRKEQKMEQNNGKNAYVFIFHIILSNCIQISYNLKQL